MTHPLNEKEIFRVARSLCDRSRRSSYLDASCGDDLSLRQRVEALLAAHESAGDFLSRAPVDDLDAGLSIAKVGPGSIIGRYKVLEQIGEGGFGIVYMADQLEPVQRRVALKVIKPGMDTKQVVGRFTAERQALAMMDHPHIAKVFDAGSTDAGLPYFVMELVPGSPMTHFCDENRLNAHQRLELFIKVCLAVQHAHQKGIIHRDLKPTNVLVTLREDQAVPKVIDFGVAKAIQQRLTERTVFTEFKQFIGTPAYMSPEQAVFSDIDIDTRSDIYSLGVLLYELLTGTTPLEEANLRRMAYDQMCQSIRDDVPPVPSTRVSTLGDRITKICQNRSTEPGVLRRLLRGDIDWVVMKAIEKDRARRYETANELAADIQRYLCQEPVLAVPPSAMYRLQKFARRNMATLTSLAAIAAILILTTTISTWQAFRAVKAEREQSRLLGIAEKALAGETAQSAAARKEATRAEAGELWARRLAYTSDMIGVDHALQQNNLGRARRLLDRNRPALEETDLRNWEWRALWQRCRGDATATFGDRGRSFWSMSVSPDGKWLATGGLKGEIRVWDIELKKTVATLSPHTPSFEQHGEVVFARKGDRLFATAGGGVVKVWTAPSWLETDLQFSHGSPIRAISLSFDGTILAIFGCDEMISLWNVKQPAKPRRMRGGHGGGRQTGAVAISHDNQWLAIGQGDGSIWMVDLKTGEKQFQFPATVEGELIKTLAFSPDGQFLASGTGYADAAVDLWSVSERKLLSRLQGHSRFVRDVVFSPDGTLLASASCDQTIRIWDAETWTNSAVLKGHQQEVMSLAFTSDGAKLVSGSKDGTISLWNTGRRTEAAWPISLPDELPEGYEGMRSQGRASFAPGGKWLATRNKDGSISLRNANNLKETQRLSELGMNNAGVLFAPHGRLLVVGDDAGCLTWLDPWQPKDRKLQRLLPSAELFPVGFSLDGTQLLVLARDNDETVCIVSSVADGKRAQSWSIPPDGKVFALSPDGRLVVTGHDDGAIRFWQVADPREPVVVKHRDYISSVAFSPDGSLLVAGTRYGEADIWDVATRTRSGVLRGHMAGVHDARFSPDGTRVATAGGEGETVKLWDLATQQEVATLIAPGFTFGKVEFSPDGNAILAINVRGALYVWRVPTWDEIPEAEDGQRVLIPTR